ncbi:MAG: nucleotidyltransferase family protein [Anaerolineae bacterium]
MTKARVMQQAELTAETILAALNAHSAKLYELGARKLGLFGSFVRGEQTPDSDIDILVTLARPSYDDYCNIKFFLEDFFGREVDLVMEDGLKERIRPYVMKEVVYVEGL